MALHGNLINGERVTGADINRIVNPSNVQQVVGEYARGAFQATSSGNSQTGIVSLPTTGVDYHVPFGGRKASSDGPREQGTYAREFYATVKTSYTAP